MESTPHLSPVLARVSVAAGLRHATVAGRDLHADNARELHRRLVNALYETFHSGHRPGETPAPLVRDRAFEAELKAATPHTTTLAAAPRAGTGVVLVDGVRVRLPDAPASPGEPVRLPAHRPALSPGYFLVDGSRGRGAARRPVLRVYVHVGDPAEAVRTWRAVTRALEDSAVPYRAKVLSARPLYPRRDGLVVYLGPAAWRAAPLIVAAAPPARTNGPHPRTSAFARAVAPGVALAWEPEDDRPGYRGMSFGQHRATVIADAVLAHAQERNPERTLHEHVSEQVRAAGIAPDAYYRNLHSPFPAALENLAR
ncbi:T3SS effector HopA1 family protein [Streptomyces sp. MAR4 CNX-425]|uniref:T3SS effector HopA1 family protein n=1 Tax=Streptomyces sp. MAR4 CNX-425 TaxID=3406343 RepID=UPI003B501023